MDKSKIRKYLLIGLIGAFITLAGEMAQGLAPTAGGSDMLGLFETHAALPVWRLGFGSTVGAAGIMLQFFGVWAIYLSFENREDRRSRLYRIGAYNYAFMGALVHILMSVMLWAYKTEGALPADFTLWFAAPFLAVFLGIYAVFCVIMLLKFRKGETMFPKACWLLNPLIGKVFFKVIAAIIPAGALANGISFSNMGLTAVVMFSVLWYKAK